MKRCFVIIFIIILPALSGAQAPDTSVVIFGKGTTGPYTLGFKNLISGSINIIRDGVALDTSAYSLETGEGVLQLSTPLAIGDSLMASFRYLPLRLKSRYYLREFAVAGPDTVIDPPIPVGWDNIGSDLNITGSKGFVVQSGRGGGNSLSQSLNLSIVGELVPGLQTSAHISDKSSGRSGVSRRLEELDKIYITAESDNFKGTFGDFDYHLQNDPLLGFQRKLTGLSVIFSKDGSSFQGAAAFFPGEYSSITISGRDGRLGPYYLTDIGGRQGAEVLPGSERVYLDGVLQQRGSQSDYEIDYLAGTIQFAPSKVIRDESRITIDYELAREEYSRGFFAASGDAAPVNGFRLYSSLVQEGDNKGSPKSFELTPETRQILEQAGGDRLMAAQSGVRYVGAGLGDYNIDTTGAARYIYAGDGGGEYDVVFSYMAERAGSYRALGGGVFEYVGPGLGTYEPVVLLPLPEMKRYGSVGAAWLSPDSAFRFEGELAGSSLDRNALSSLDPVNPGLAALGGASFRRQMFGPEGHVGIGGRIRKIGEDAIFPGRIDAIERYRDYDLDLSLTPAGERVEEVELSLGLNTRRNIKFDFGYLTHPDIKSRKRGGADLNWSLFGPLDLHSSAERTSGERAWWKTSNSVTARFRPVQPSFRIDHERRDGIGGFKFVEYVATVPAAYARDITGATEVSFRDEKYLDGDWRDKFRSGSISQKLNFIAGQTGFSGELAGSYYRKNYQDFSGSDSEQKTGWTRLSFADPQGRGSFSVNERLGSTSERRQARSYIYVGQGRGDYRFEDGEYIADPDGEFIVIVEELGEGAKITQVATEINGSVAPFLLIDKARKIEDKIGRLSVETDLTYELKKASGGLAGRDLVPWRTGGLANAPLQKGEFDIRAYYYAPRGKHRLRYNLLRSFEDGSPYVNETTDNELSSHEASWAFPIVKTIDISLSFLTSDSRHSVNTLRYNIGSRKAAAAVSYRPGKSWTISLGSSYGTARQTDTGFRATLPGGELGLARDFAGTGRLSASFGYTRLNSSPGDAYIPFQVAQGKGRGDNFEAGVSARMAVTQNGRFDLSYRFEDYPLRKVKHNFRLEFTVMLL